MADIAGWVALAATCLAALMTASNLGPRITGWGFVVFTVGAIAWIVVGIATKQTQLLYSNIFLGLVDLFGIWRWLGNRAQISDAAQAEEARSEQTPGEELFSVATLDGMALESFGGDRAAVIADAMIGCRSGNVRTLIVKVGGFAGVGETLHVLPWSHVQVRQGKAFTSLTVRDVGALALVAAEDNEE